MSNPRLRLVYALLGIFNKVSHTACNNALQFVTHQPSFMSFQQGQSWEDISQDRTESVIAHFVTDTKLHQLGQTHASLQAVIADQGAHHWLGCRLPHGTESRRNDSPFC